MAASIQESFAITSCNCVAFRLDDIQNYFLNNAQVEIINTFQKNNANLTVGVIGNYFGEDPVITNFLKERLENGTPKIEIANHGWNHENFSEYDKAQQHVLILKTNEKISSMLGVMPIGFITPFNALNDDTLSALKENKMVYISANKTADPPPYALSNTELYRLPSVAYVGNFNNDDTDWVTKTHKQTHVQILDGLLNYGYAIVTMHPQDFVKRDKLSYSNEVDWNQIHELELLIDAIRNDGLKIVTISDIPQHANVHQKTPEWIKTIFDWYEDDKISADEVLNAIKYLKEKKILQLDI
ncbi:MAG TPA: polysaccharide deacetylase family protein [Nitrosopumilaceae archaeon]|nr:polysaccharide deacetylase family protein [Nitrosopumilaceae archaeon]